MSHKQTNSLCTIPFSWEMIPGVPKYMTSPKSSTTLGELHKEAMIIQKAHDDLPTPPPPLPPPGCYRDPIMKRSASSKFWREEDPFLVALKECSKDSSCCKVNKSSSSSSEKKKFGIWGNKSFLWCRCSFDVQEGNLVRKRPVLPSRVRSVGHQQRADHGLIMRMHKGSRKYWNT